ncbi:hypothetical protein [Spectribacter hydrogenoxidans]|uniref:Uncharacterized protein n=1 Tax=Spectribacter hydrogenoxidans TaxID=3075608 RepID=A0ABU3C1W8_9GAMM|nr:hypothetical protein [Salinisphaera sp. W335]MDT0635359.1 hypothetical protein [Salinisphaera sp. W335]
MATPDPHNAPPPANDRQIGQFERMLDNLAAARSFGKGMHQTRLLALVPRLLDSDDGVAALYRLAPRFDSAGVFLGGDWAEPANLQPRLVRVTLLSGGMMPALECLNQLRLLAIATGEAEPAPDFDAGAARRFLDEVLASNLDLLFPTATESDREQPNPMRPRLQRLFAFLVRTLGMSGLLAALVDEAERVLQQRPIMVQRIEHLLHAAHRALNETDAATGDDSETRARRLIDALHGPTELAREHAGDDYTAALTALDPETLAVEARVFGESMAGTGLVAPQHALLLRYLAENAPERLPDALALGPVGRVVLVTHGDLVSEIIGYAIFPETARCIYGLCRLLEQGTLFFDPVPPGLRRLMVLPMNEDVAEQLRATSEWPTPPTANVLLVAGTLSVLGQPRGVDQGHNPTCQAARAISMWAQNDAGYLLELIARAARDGELLMHFEGDAIASAGLDAGLAKSLHTELDPVSLVLTSHLDRVYMEMSRRTIDRPGDGHRWVNPEFHGWWVKRGFAEVLDDDQAVSGCDDFIRLFHAAYHPVYNGGRQLVYVQPCGVAVTDYRGEFVGWHAIAIERIERGPEGEWRVYFYNPNRDRGQDWGQGVVTTTRGHGELEGESSLPFGQFVSRLYVFHYETREVGDPAAVPDADVAAIREAIAVSWAANIPWAD